MNSESIPDQEKEIELLRKTGEGDRLCFKALYDRYSTVLFSTAYKVLNDPTEAQDVLQDVFIQIWDKASLYDPARGKPLTWAMTLTRNKAIDRLRSLQRRHRLRDQVEKETQVFEQNNLSEDSSEQVYVLEKGRVVRNAVMQLSEDQRIAIEMAFFSGKTQNEIAEELNEPLGTVKARIRRGMMRLREIIARRL